MKENKNKNKKTQFIKTSDESTAEMLRKANFTELTETSSTTYCFLNDGKLTFEGNEEISKKIMFTNVLCV